MSALNKRIMRRVYAVYLYHKLLNPTALKLYVLAIFATTLSASVSISHVIANMPAVSNFGAWYQFNVSAFGHTETSVKIVLASVLMLTLWLLRDLIKTFVVAHSRSQQKNLLNISWYPDQKF